jgi:branched-chain amino acid transport system permease protein
MSDARRSLPGLVRDGDETRVRVTRGLVLSRRQAALALVGVLALFAVPDLTRVSPSVQLTVLHQGVLFGLAAVGLNLLLRHTRLVSFGHAAFFGTGAYVVALLATKLDVAFFGVLLVAAVLAATVMAAVIGFLSLRHTGLYFSLLTLAFGQLLYALVYGLGFFGQSDGLPVRPGAANKPLIFGLALDADAYPVLLYYVTVVLLLVSLVVTYRVVNSPFGAALDAIGQDRTRARFIGVPVRRYVWLAFTLSGVYGGLAGGLYAMVQQHVRPEPVLYFLRSGDILFMAILGGFQTLLGPLVGGVVLVFLQDVGRDVTAYFDALTGFVLLLLVFAFPEGIVGSLGGGSLRRGVAALRADPTVAVAWLRRAATAVLDALREAGSTLASVVGVR